MCKHCKSTIVVLCCLAIVVGSNVGAATGPFQATGIRIGEVSDRSAIIWTRLTRDAERVGADAPMPIVAYRDLKTNEPVKASDGPRSRLVPTVTYPDGSTVETIEGAVPGLAGQVRVRFRRKGSEKWRSSDWQEVDPRRDYTHQFRLTSLTPGTTYELQVEARQGQIVEGGFKTAPATDREAPVLFMVSTCQAYPDQDMPGGGYKIYPAMLKLDPDFFVHAGDILYYDKLAKSIELARWHWQRMYSLPTNVEFHRRVAGYFMKDDHDTWVNDCWPTMKCPFMGEFTFEQGQAVFLEQVPMGERTWRTFRWGKDLQIWLMEGRDYRSPNTMPDGPDKTIWGGRQKAWFKRTLQESTATFRILISPTPIVGPDRKNKHDNHSNVDFAHEGNELRDFLSKQKNVYVLCGDRHWQYVSVDPKTGVREYSCGAASDEHAGGWSNDKRLPEHRYLNVIGGFLSVAIDRVGGTPRATFRHYGVDGDVLNEDIRVAE